MSSLPKVDKLTPRPLFFTPLQDKAGSKQSHLFRKTVPASSSLENMLNASADSWFSMFVHTEAVYGRGRKRCVRTIIEVS